MSDYETNGWVYPTKEILVELINNRPIEDAMQARCDELENAWLVDEGIQRDGSLRPSLLDTIERAKQLGDERDALQAKLDIAVEALIIANSLVQVESDEDAKDYETVREALKKLEDKK